MKETSRTRKMNESLREAIALILLDAVSDPRLDFVTVTGVRVSPDMAVANVYVTAHGDASRYQEVLAGLESAKGRIRGILGGKITTRVTPELRFFIDESVDAGMRIAEALKSPPASLSLDPQSPPASDSDSTQSDTSG